MIPLFRHNIGEEDIERCNAVLRSNWHTAGPVGEQVEKQISEYYQGYHVALTSSCTSGLMAVAVAIGLKPGDEVIVPAMTFTATAANVLHYGAKPVFVDTDYVGLIDIDQIEAKITEKTKAIYVVNLYGHMPDIERISQIAKKHNLFLLEDCAHAFESTRDGHRPATFSDVAVYSFYATKTVHCGEGGAVISQNKELIERVRQIRRHGLSLWPCPGQPGNMGYNVVEMGFKGILSDIHASLLVSQIRDADKNRKAREDIAMRYYQHFKKLKNVRCLMPDLNVKSAWYTFPIIVENRSSLTNCLKEKDIGHTIMYQSLEEFDVYKTNISCPKAFSHGKKQLSLPCYPNLTFREQDDVIEATMEWDKCF